MIASAEEFRRLRTSSEPADYQRAAHDAAPVEVWLDVIARMPEMRPWVAHNKTVPVAILDILATDPDLGVRMTVARKRKLPESLQLRLTQDPSPDVRAALAANAKITRRVMQVLLEDGDDRVRRDAASWAAKRGLPLG